MLCREPGCQRRRDHSERSHVHRRWVINDNGGAEYDPIYWSTPEPNEIDFVDKTETRRK